MLGYGWYVVLAVLVLIGTAAAIYERNNYADWCILICAVVFMRSEERRVGKECRL